MKQNTVSFLVIQGFEINFFTSWISFY